MKLTIVRRTKLKKKPNPDRRGGTNADGTRAADAPKNWPFGTVPVQPARVSAAQPKVRKKCE